MKKAWIILIALALLAFSMPIFADAPAAGSFHAWNQGNLFPYYSVGGGTGEMGWGPTWDVPPAMGIDQEWTFSYDGNNYGFNGTFEFGGGFFTTGSTSPGGGALSWFATYYKFGDIAKVTIGRPRFNDYTEFSQVEGNNFKRFGDSDYMAIVQFFPVAGASIAAALYVPYITADIAGVAGSLSGSTFKPDYGENFGLAASYAVPNLVSVKVMGRISEATAGDNSSSSTYISGGVNFSGVKGVVVNGDVQANLSNSGNTVIGAFLSASTSMFAPLSAAVDLVVISNSASQGNNPQTPIAIELNAEYVVAAPFSIGATVGYDGGTGWLNQGIGNYLTLNAWNGLEIYPYVKANFDNGSSLKIGVVYTSGGINGTASAIQGQTNNASQSVLAVPIIYVWSF
jgi:hypothetical protein